MYALFFDMVKVDDIEINQELKKFDFFNLHGNLYITKNTDLSNLFRAINALKNIEWFKQNVKDIRTFKIENLSDFTDYIKE